MDLVSHIFHEQQEGNLCAQHCLNALLQGPYFTAIDLAELARQLDQKEQDALGLFDFAGSPSPAGQRSQNMDDSGFFSVQVLSHALSIWNIQIIPWGAEEVHAARAEPEREAGFICNLDLHWYTLRRFGPSTKCWYDLNSMHPRPQYMSATYLGMTLSQLEAEGYSIFVVRPLIQPVETIPESLKVVEPPPQPPQQQQQQEPEVVAETSTPSTHTTTESVASSESTNGPAAASSFLTERQEMERLRRQRIAERERAESGAVAATEPATTSSSSSSTTTTTAPAPAPESQGEKTPRTTSKRAHADHDEQDAPERKEAKRSTESTLVTTPSFLPGCEADLIAAATMPPDNTRESDQPSKHQSFAGSGYRLGGASAPSPPLPPSDTTSLPQGFTLDDTDDADTEWEMMQQAIAMSLQGHPQ
ncbi:Josephin-domain-containing protein [Mortierella sp. GBAus27b]|nr:Ataxin-3 [Mortierella sp. GBA43]KAI8361488.1 Josephin-domain-containing protein [Mortierella sp. GBAus27b]